MAGAEGVVPESLAARAAAAHAAAASACEKAIEAILVNRATPSPENDWAEVVATDAAWEATETASKRSREAGYAVELTQQALKAIEAFHNEETGSDRAIAWLRTAAGAHRAAAQAYKVS